MDGTIESTSRQSRVDVCAYVDGVPACGSATVECPAKGCKPPALGHGTIRLVDKAGPREFSVE